MSMALWDWMLSAYERPGVPETCLKLQDEHAQNTSFLLWALWARTEDADLLARAAEATRRFDQTALVPLRAVRRALKPSCPPVADDAREALREQVKVVELQAERVLVETLERLSGAPCDGGVSGLTALQAARQAWGAAAPEPALASLAAILE
jgi:uncharacterized protein (TIGR02444 family)